MAESWELSAAPEVHHAHAYFVPLFKLCFQAFGSGRDLSAIDQDEVLGVNSLSVGVYDLYFPVGSTDDFLQDAPQRRCVAGELDPVGAEGPGDIEVEEGMQPDLQGVNSFLPRTPCSRDSF